MPKRRPYDEKAYRATRKRMKGLPCIYCGAPSDTVEHLRPLRLGGTNDPDNLAPACRRCNSSKGGKLKARLAKRRERNGNY